MGTITSSRRIEASPAEVFAVITDLENAADRISAITKMEILSEGPFSVGTRWRETRVMFKKECTEEMWVTEVDPGRGYSTEASSHGSEYRCRLSVEPDGTGAILTISMDAKPVSIMAKLMSPLCVLFTGALRKCFEKDLEDIRVAIEGAAPSEAVAV